MQGNTGRTEEKQRKMMMIIMIMTMRVMPMMIRITVSMMVICEDFQIRKNKSELSSELILSFYPHLRFVFEKNPLELGSDKTV